MFQFTLFENMQPSCNGNCDGFRPVFCRYFIQIVSIVLGPVNAYMDWLSFFGISITPSNNSGGSSNSNSSFLSCLAPYTGMANFYLSYATSAILYVDLLVFAVIVKVYRSCCANRPSNDNIVTRTLSSKIPMTSTSFIRSFASLLIITYISLTTTTLNYLQSVNVGSYCVIFSQPAISCTSNEYTTFKGFVIFMLVVYVIGLPLSLFMFLYLNRTKVDQLHEYRRRLRNQSDAQLQNRRMTMSPLSSSSNSSSSRNRLSNSVVDDDGNTDTSSNNPITRLLSAVSNIFANIRSAIMLPLNESSLQFAHRYGVLFQHQTRSHYYWIMVILMRRAVCSVFAVIYFDDTSARALSILLLHLISYVLQVYTRPYRHRMNNFLEEIVLIALIAIASIIASYHAPPYPIKMQIMICVLIVVTLAVCITAFVSNLIYLKKRAELPPVVIENDAEVAIESTENKINNAPFSDAASVLREC